jgi:hypothetical protein
MTNDHAGPRAIGSTKLIYGMEITYREEAVGNRGSKKENRRRKKGGEERGKEGRRKRIWEYILGKEGLEGVIELKKGIRRKEEEGRKRDRMEGREECMSREEGKAVGQRKEEVGRRRKGEVGSRKRKEGGRGEGMESKRRLKKRKYTTMCITKLFVKTTE